jgi:ribonuclease BN (tRNA processing enzyme)
MADLGIDPGSIDAVVVTHLHGDHFGGIPFLALREQFAKRDRPLVVAGPAGASRAVPQAMEALFPGSSTAARPYALRVVEYRDGSPLRLGPFEITPLKVGHHPEANAHGLRVAAGGRVVAYSGDTEWTDALVDLARDADVFICECYSLEKRIPFHLDHATLTAHRGALRCRRLVATHLGPEMIASLERADVEVATDGMTIRL